MEEEIKKEDGLQQEPQAEPETAAGAEAGGAAEPQAPEAAEKKEDRKKEKKERKAAAALEKELGAVKERLAGVEKSLAGAKETLMRTAAEYDNYRKRTAREKDATFNNGVTFAVTQLLPVVDTLEMAAAAPTEDENYKKGVEMTLTKCVEAFGKLGIQEIEALGKPFDPELHSAVMQDPATDEAPSGTVTRVLQKGYQLDGKVVRHAAVAVAE